MREIDSKLKELGYIRDPCFFLNNYCKGDVRINLQYDQRKEDTLVTVIKRFGTKEWRVDFYASFFILEEAIEASLKSIEEKYARDIN